MKIQGEKNSNYEDEDWITFKKYTRMDKINEHVDSKNILSFVYLYEEREKNNTSTKGKRLQKIIISMKNNKERKNEGNKK